MIEQMTMASYNVQCLGKDTIGRRKRREIKEFFQNTNPKPEILLIQEHTYSLKDCMEKSKEMDFLRGSAFWNEAQYSAEKDSLKGGTGILTSARLAAHISEHGVIVPGRAQFITFQLTQSITIGIINVYAFNYTEPYIRLVGTIPEVWDF
jgi:hypothetical protein